MQFLDYQRVLTLIFEPLKEGLFVSNVSLKGAESLRGNAIRTKKNLILCHPTTVDRMPDGQQPNLGLTGEICEVHILNCYIATLPHCYTATLLNCHTATQERYMKLPGPTQRPAFLHDVSPQ